MEFAQRVEERNQLVHGPKAQMAPVSLWNKGGQGSSGFRLRNNQTIGGGSKPTNPTLTARCFFVATDKPKDTSSGAAPFRRLTDAELQAKREKGLCYHCDGKYSFGYRCSNRELQVLIVREEEDSAGEKDDCAELEAEEEVVELSLNSVVGFTSPKTMKLKRILCGQEVIVLIDSGATQFHFC